MVPGSEGTLLSSPELVCAQRALLAKITQSYGDARSGFKQSMAPYIMDHTALFLPLPTHLCPQFIL